MSCFSELDSRVRKVATWLQSQGITPGQVVCVQAPKSLVLLELILGCLAQGVVILPLNEAYQLDQCLFYLSDSEAALYIGPHDIAQIEDCKQLSLRNCRAEIQAVKPSERSCLRLTMNPWPCSCIHQARLGFPKAP